MKKIITESESDTEKIGAIFAKNLPDGTVVALHGELGVGKTAFVRGMALGLGIECRVTSPTFTIVNEYVGERILIHFDMYRIHNSDELFDIGWEDYLRRNAICVVEWSENVPGAFDGDEIKIFFKRMSDNERLIAIMEPANKKSRLK